MSGIGVVIPARDEQELIGDCLASIAGASALVAVPVVVVVVADGCSDSTADVARGFAGVEVVELAPVGVGLARARGVAAVLAHGVEWIACTDADSTVPENWLAEQWSLHREGRQLMIGTVRPRFAELSPAHVAHWRATHRRGFPNGHVHGANLGLSAAAYRAAGGFAGLDEHEDVDLVARLRALGVDEVATDACEVETSARFAGRTAGGYAGHLRRIEAELAG